ncbi:PilZ domain-containing protein [Haliangium ochraceum]|uniref:PilZ domain-containing protein n=1 Tax=Haliangium ochraceum TaxID=80816 RepID=UPI00019BA290|nr:PilZ domain-containing protein [Haliangium ochraceum]
MRPPRVVAVGGPSRKFEATVRDISVNGAFIAGEPLALLTRVSFSFDLPGYGTIDALGWSLWRRENECEGEGVDGSREILPRGFGILFEAMPLEARVAIQKFVQGRR